MARSGYEPPADSRSRRLVEELRPGIVHMAVLSLEPLQEKVDELEGVLSGDEQARAARYRYARDRNAFILGRAALRHMLAAYVGRSPDQLHFDYGEFGKPAFAPDGDAGEIRFNASGSQGLVGIAVARAIHLGIDIEQVRPFADWSQIVGRFFTESEQKALFQLPADRQLTAFFHCWTMKEAASKLSGEGLQDLDRFEVSMDSLEAPAVVSRRAGDGPLPRSLWTFRVERGGVLALASEGVITDVAPAVIASPAIRCASLAWAHHGVARVGVAQD